MHSSLLLWRYIYLKRLKDLSQNAQNVRSVEMDNLLLGTYKNSMITHGWHIYATAYDMDMDTMCAYPPSQHTLPHWKCVLSYSYNGRSVDLPGQK